MEGKGRGGGAQSTTAARTSELVVVEQQPQQQQQAPRRRAGALKRKANKSSSSSKSAKRQARERPIVPLHPLHYGPITRARQSPNKFAVSAAEAAATAAAASAATSTAPSAPLPQNPSELLPNPVFSAAGGVTTATEESNAANEELVHDLEPLIDAEFEAIRSRDDNAHVIPTHAGWFSWTKVHPLEEHALASFFSGKYEKRTPDVYMEIRNLIVKKFHEVSKTPIEQKDLLELSVGELDIRQEIKDFLDHWGLINFQPFPLPDSATAALDADVAAKTASLIEKLYQFEAVESRMRVGSRADLAAPTIPPSLFPESSIADEVRSGEPAVEYHCNSCSADCSRKRYHCQKQADFDLCSECYNNGKFDSGMSHADFILMESAEVPGASGGSWTDQETLLLLEALELFGGNWNEIAEHVGTKTKAQCILHFVQMPIEDTFFEDKDDVDASLHRSTVPGSTGNDSSGLKDAPEGRDSTVETNNDSATLKSTPETTEDKSATASDSSALKDATETTENRSETKEEQPLSSPMDVSKPKDASEVKLAQEMSANTALNALREAFQAVGSLPEPGAKLSFAEAGNPVMALAAYLAGLVEPDVAAASARSSLKTISEESPGIQLAARHCFLLEDSSDSKNVALAPVSTGVEMVDEEAKKNEDQKEENHQEENHTFALDGSDEPKNCIDKKMEEAIPEEKESVLSLGDEGKGISDAAKKPDDESTPQDVAPSAVKESGDSALPREDPPSSATESVDTPLPAEVLPSSVKESCNAMISSSLGKDDKTVNDSKEEKNGNVVRIKRAAITALSAAAVKAKLLADQEEDQIRQLATFLLDKQLHKLEIKLSFFTEIESMIMRAREQMDRSRQRLYQERAQIIASRLGLPASSSRTVPSTLPVNRVAISYANAVPKPHPGMSFQRPPMKTRPSAPVSGSSIPGTFSRASPHISQQEKLSSLRTR